MKITFIGDKKKTYNALIWPLFSGEKQLKSLPHSLRKIMKNKLFKGSKNETLFVPSSGDNEPHFILMGLGSQKKFSPQILLQSACMAYKTACRHQLESTAVNVSLGVGDLHQNIQTLAKAFFLSDYKFDDYQTKKKNIKKLGEVFLLMPSNSLSKTASKNKLNQSLMEAKILSDSVNFARWLGDTPGNLMTPAILSEQAQKKAKGLPLQVTVWNKEKIKKEKMGGLLGVSLGSYPEPRFIIMEYKGGKPKDKPICFVGKGVTFDSGGISIKPSPRMDEMKFDMCGAGAVIGAMLAIAKLKLKINVIGLAPATENMPGGNANKPGDILTARNGKTMEILNTDAEGRLILADALSYASEKKPSAIFDSATLTGAMVVALGNSHTGFYTRDEKLRQRVISAGKKSGENVWPMPLTDDHVQDIRSETADVANIATAPHGAGSATAAAFLEHFVGENIPWAHFDIAGTAWNVSKRLAYCSPKGASGVMVQTFVELAKSYCP